MKDKISKIINVWKKDGIIVTIQKSCSYIKANYLVKIDFITNIKIMVNKRKYLKEIQNILYSNSFDRIVIWRSSFGYNVPLFQRPQHIANNLSCKKCLVFYEVTTMTDKVRMIKKIKDNLFLVNFKNRKYSNLLYQEINKINKPKYLQFYSTDWTLSLEEIKWHEKNKYKIIYEYIDDLNPQISGTSKLPKNIIDKYNYAIGNKEIFIVTTADILYQDILKKRGDINLVSSTNGVDYSFYKTFDEFELEDEYLDIINNGKINICYYGALASWFDYNLIKQIADTDKYNIILFGVKYDDYFDKNINNYKNIYFLGAKEYRYLKYYVKQVDLLIIPFLINDITKATSPVKIFEYMALNKPIITTNMNECKKYKSVFIGKNNKEFINNLTKAYNMKNNKEYIKLLDSEARSNDWSKKADDIINLIIKKENL